MSKRYELELYVIRDNELEFALRDNEAETSQGTTKMVEKKLNRQDKRIKELEHKLDTLTGLYATDQTPTPEDIKKYHMWRLEE